jgi:hypothetical protein
MIHLKYDTRNLNFFPQNALAYTELHHCYTTPMEDFSPVALALVKIITIDLYSMFL